MTRLVLFVLIAACVGMPISSLSQAQQQAPQSVDVEVAGDRLFLWWKGGVKASLRQEGRDFIIAFDRPLGDAMFEQAAAQLAPYVETMNWGYDSILLVLRDNVEVNAVTTAKGLEISFVSGEATATQPIGNALLRRKLLDAQIMLRDGEIIAARTLLRDLNKKVPGRVDVVTQLASAEAQLGNWAATTEHYRELATGDPRNGDITRAYHQARREHGNRLAVSTTFQDVEDGDEQLISTAQFRIHPSMLTTIFGSVENRLLDVSTVTERDGRTGSFDRNRGNAMLGIGYKYTDTSDISARIHLNPASVGSGVNWQKYGDLGRYDLDVVYHAPENAYVEGIVGHAVEDRIRLSVNTPTADTYRFSGHLQASRYGLQDDADLAKTLGFGFGAETTVYDAGPSVTLGYQLNAEYIQSKTERTAPNGILFDPLPIVSREVHSVSLGIGDTIGTDWEYQINGGYAYDRLNERGPEVAGRLQYQPTNMWEVFVEGGRSLSKRRGGDATVNRLSGGLGINF